MFKFSLEVMALSICTSVAALIGTGYVWFFATNLPFLTDIGLWIAAGTACMAMASIPFIIMGAITESLKSSPKPTVQRTNNVHADYTQSGVWGKDKNGRTVDLRQTDPERAFRALGIRPRPLMEVVEQSVSRDGKVVYEVLAPIEPRRR